MPSLSDTTSYNASYRFPSSYTPVAVFVGGSGGIGASMADALARYTKGNIHIIIAARNEQASRELLRHITSYPHVLREFVYCEYTLLKNTRAAVERISELIGKYKLPRIDYLIFSANHWASNKREDTDEGHDYQLRIKYYHRFEMTCALMPFLDAESRVMTLMGANKKSAPVPIPEDDYEFRRSPTGSGAQGPAAAIVYNDVGFKELSLRYPHLTFIHINPGLTLGGQSKEILAKFKADHPFSPLMYYASKGIAHMVMKKPEEAAEHMVYALLYTRPGFNRLDEKAEDLGPIDHRVNGGSFFAHSVTATGVFVKS